MKVIPEAIKRWLSRKTRRPFAYLDSVQPTCYHVDVPAHSGLVFCDGEALAEFFYARCREHGPEYVNDLFGHPATPSSDAR